MNYLEDVVTYLKTEIFPRADTPSVSIYLENFSKIEGENQIVVMSEPSSVDRNSPVVRIKFGVYCRHSTTPTAREWCDKVWLSLNNKIGKLDLVSTNVFHCIKVINPTYFYGNEANRTMYFCNFEAVLIEPKIKTYQLNSI